MDQAPLTPIPLDPKADAVIIPNYASIMTPRSPPGNTLLHVAVACALLPLAVGVLCFVLWFITSWNGFPIGGLLTIAIGTLLAVIGVSCLLTHYVATASRAVPGARRWRPTRRHWLTLLLLCINFPIAYGLVAAAFYIDKVFVVTITNSGALPVDDLALNFTTGKLHLTDIAPHSTIKRRLCFNALRVDYSLKQGGVRAAGTIDANVYSGDVQITVHDGKLDATRAPGGNSGSHFSGDL